MQSTTVKYTLAQKHTYTYPHKHTHTQMCVCVSLFAHMALRGEWQPVRPPFLPSVRWQLMAQSVKLLNWTERWLECRRWLWEGQGAARGRNHVALGLHKHTHKSFIATPSPRPGPTLSHSSNKAVAVADADVAARLVFSHQVPKPPQVCYIFMRACVCVCVCLCMQLGYSVFMSRMCGLGDNGMYAA